MPGTPFWWVLVKVDLKITKMHTPKTCPRYIWEQSGWESIWCVWTLKSHMQPIKACSPCTKEQSGWKNTGVDHEITYMHTHKDLLSTYLGTNWLAGCLVWTIKSHMHTHKDLLSTYLGTNWLAGCLVWTTKSHAHHKDLLSTHLGTS